MISSAEQTLAFQSVTELMKGPTTPLVLDDASIHVWSCSLEGSGAERQCCEGWLSEEERARATRFVREEDQARFILAHGILRRILARYIDAEPADLGFNVSPTGKPVLLGRRGGVHDVRFNLSHSHGRMLVSVAKGREVGIDLEQIRDNRQLLRLAERFFTPMEFEWIKNQSESDHALQFYRLWVAKEAFLKAQGRGISSLQQCEILLSSPGARAGVCVTGEMQPGCFIQWLNCGAGWQGAVSAHGDDWSVRIVSRSSEF
jgi:4'-phosphopantetheinyl transferase